MPNLTDLHENLARVALTGRDLGDVLSEITKLAPEGNTGARRRVHHAHPR